MFQLFILGKVHEVPLTYDTIILLLVFTTVSNKHLAGKPTKIKKNPGNILYKKKCIIWDNEVTVDFCKKNKVINTYKKVQNQYILHGLT